MWIDEKIPFEFSADLPEMVNFITVLYSINKGETGKVESASLASYNDIYKDIKNFFVEDIALNNVWVHLPRHSRL